MKTIGNYPGGKAKHFVIYDYIPKAALGFVDVFGGSGAVGLNLPRQRPFHLYNDLSSRMVNLFSVLLFQFDELLDMVERTPFGEWTLRTAVAKERETDDAVIQAWATLVRLHMSRNRPFRESPHFQRKYQIDINQRNGNLGTSGARRWKRLPVKLCEVVEIVTHWELSQKTAVEVIDLYARDVNCLFLDPPYWEGVRQTVAFYDVEMAGAEEHEAFLTAVVEAKPCYRVITHPPCDLYSDYLLPAGFQLVTYTAQSNGASYQEGVYVCPLTLAQLRKERKDRALSWGLFAHVGMEL